MILCAQNLLTILGSIVNIIIWGDLSDQCRWTQEFPLWFWTRCSYEVQKLWGKNGLQAPFGLAIHLTLIAMCFIFYENKCPTKAHLPQELLCIQGILQKAVEATEYWRLCDTAGKPSGLIGWWPEMASFFTLHYWTVFLVSSFPSKII